MTDERDYKLAHRLLDLIDRVDDGKSISIPYIIKMYGGREAAAGRYIEFVRKRRPRLVDKTMASGEKQWRLPRVERDGDERDFWNAALLVFAEQQLHWLRGTHYEGRLTAMVREARERAPADRQDQLFRLAHSFVSLSAVRAHSLDPQIVNVLLDAISGLRRCRLRYVRLADGEGGDYVIEPWVLLQHRGHLHVLAGKLPGPVRRTFDVRGIERIALTDDRFTPPLGDAISPHAMFAHSFGIYTDFPPVDVVVRLRGHATRLVLRFPIHDSQTPGEIDSDGWTEVRWHIGLCPELHAFLLGLVPDVRVLEPEPLVRELARRIAAAADSTIDP